MLPAPDKRPALTLASAFATVRATSAAPSPIAAARSASSVIVISSSGLPYTSAKRVPGTLRKRSARASPYRPTSVIGTPSWSALSVTITPKAPAPSVARSGVPTPRGNVRSASPSLSRNSDQTPSIRGASSVSSNSTCTMDTPVADVDVTTSTSETSRRTSSISAVTNASTRAGSAPG